MILRIYPQNPAEREIRRVVEALERDGVVVYPTDSVYAYGCSLRSARGLERLRQLSGKQTGELSIICDGISRAAEYCRVDNAAFKILKRNLPGAITFLLDASSRMPDKALQRRKTIGVRIPDNAIPRAIVEQLGCPLITASLKSDDDRPRTDPRTLRPRSGAGRGRGIRFDRAHHGGRPHAGRARNRAAGCGGTQLTDIMTRSNSI